MLCKFFLFSFSSDALDTLGFFIGDWLLFLVARLGDVLIFTMLMFTPPFCFII